MATQYFTAAMAGEVLGVTPRRVRQLARAYFIGERFGRALCFTSKDLLKMQDRRPDYRLLNTGIPSGAKEWTAAKSKGRTAKRTGKKSAN
jgi:hypothetical protein